MHRAIYHQTNLLPSTIKRTGPFQHTIPRYLVTRRTLHLRGVSYRLHPNTPTGCRGLILSIQNSQTGTRTSPFVMVLRSSRASTGTTEVKRRPRHTARVTLPHQLEAFEAEKKPLHKSRHIYQIMNSGTIKACSRPHSGPEIQHERL
jgi:hypothetical protein